MAQTEDQSSKTEEPTEKKLRDARRKGDVPSSKEPGNTTGIFSLFVMVVFLAPELGGALAGVLSGLIAHAGDVEIGTGRAGLADLGGVLEALAGPLAGIIGPIFLVMAVAAVFGVLIQGDTVVAPERLKPKLSNVSPAKGFSRIYGATALVEFLKNLAKLCVVAVISLWVCWAAVERLLPGAVMTPQSILPSVGRDAGGMLLAVTAFLVPIAVADILWKRFQWIKRNRMSVTEIRDERKQMEGSPEVKQKRAQIRHQRARQRIATAVPKATVVLTNPTHLAVALRYERGVDAAPVCVAKGEELMAAQIRRIARAHGIPLVENRPLARALHAVAELDREIPEDHWRAVAQIVAYVMDLRRRIHRPPPPGSRLRTED